MTEQSIQLRVGPVSAIFYEGDIRYVTLQGREIVRRIYPTVRDTRWGTILPVISNLRIEQDRDGFSISYEARHHAGEIDFKSAVVISAEAQANAVTIRFELKGSATSSFKTNRTGLCLLHPVRELMGRECSVEMETETRPSKFPELISPHQLFTKMRGLRYHDEAADVEIRFEGELFETEDQRNWSDTSFKSYCRPLAKGLPYTVEKEEQVLQSILVTIRPNRETGVSPGASQSKGTVFSSSYTSSTGETPVSRKHVVPAVGTTLVGKLSARHVERLRSLGMAHLRVDARLAMMDWRHRLAMNLADAAAVGAPVELAVHVSRDIRVLQDLVNAVGDAPICRVLVFRDRAPATDAKLVEAARSIFRNVPVGGGTIANFTELNRNRPLAGAFDVLAYSVNPQVHAMDDLSLMENLEAQAHAVRTARSFAPKTPLAIGPVTLMRRPDPFAAGNDGKPVEQLDDPRQRTPLAAAWTLGSIKYLSEAGAESVTYYNATGVGAIMDERGEPYPLFDVLQKLCAMRGAEVLISADSKPLESVSLSIRHEDRIRRMVANLQPPYAISEE